MQRHGEPERQEPAQRRQRQHGDGARRDRQVLRDDAAAIPRERATREAEAALSPVRTRSESGGRRGAWRFLSLSLLPLPPDPDPPPDRSEATAEEESPRTASSNAKSEI